MCLFFFSDVLTVKRNPNIKLYGLPWVFPGWLGGDDFNPFHNRTNMVTYIMNWIKGAQEVHGLSIDYIGVSGHTLTYDSINVIKNLVKKQCKNNVYSIQFWKNMAVQIFLSIKIHFVNIDLSLFTTNQHFLISIQ